MTPKIVSDLILGCLLMSTCLNPPPPHITTSVQIISFRVYIEWQLPKEHSLSNSVWLFVPFNLILTALHSAPTIPPHHWCGRINFFFLIFRWRIVFVKLWRYGSLTNLPPLHFPLQVYAYKLSFDHRVTHDRP